ncbi:MAG: DUF4468 domain-containing protein [Flavobacteriales bacterium]
MKHRISFHFIQVLAILLFVFASGISGAQIPTDAETGEFVYEEVVQVEGISKDSLFARAADWFKRALFADDDSIVEKSPDNKFIRAIKNMDFANNVLSSLDTSIKNTLTFNLAVYFKEGRYKYKIDQMIYHYYLVAKANQTRIVSPLEKVKYLSKKRENLYREVDLRINRMINGLKSAMQGAISNDGAQDDW